MTPNGDWWDRAKTPPRSQPIEIRKRELLYTLRKDTHAVTLEKRPVYGLGAELVLSLNAHWRRMRVFTGMLQLSAALEQTIATPQERGWQLLLCRNRRRLSRAEASERSVLRDDRTIETHDRLGSGGEGDGLRWTHADDFPNIPCT